MNEYVSFLILSSFVPFAILRKNLIPTASYDFRSMSMHLYDEVSLLLFFSQQITNWTQNLLISTLFKYSGCQTILK